MVVSTPSGRASSQFPRPARLSSSPASVGVTSPRATRRFSSTLVWKTCASSAVRHTLAATSERAACHGGTPSSVSVPPRGSSSPASVASSVDLPIPDGPTIATRRPTRRSRSMPSATTGPPGQPTARPLALRYGPWAEGSGSSRGAEDIAPPLAALASAASMSSTMRQAAPADLTSCTLAGPSAEVASKAASGTRTITASQTGASCPAETALTPTTRLPRTARPMAATSTAAAIAAGTAARSRRRVRLFSREATWCIEPARRPETVSSGAPSRTASTSADSSVACL